MSVYPPPTQISQTIFNPFNYSSLDDALTIRQANNTYLIKTGNDTDYGSLTMKQPIYLPDGTATTPSLNFVNSQNCGIYLSATNTLSITTNGILRATISTTKFTSTLPIVISSGATSNCAIQPSTAINTGINLTASQVQLVAAGNAGFSMTSAIASMGVPIRAVSGTAANCGYHFLSESGMGLFYVGTNVMGVAAGAAKVLEIGTTGISFTNSGVVGASPTPLNYFEEFSYSTTFGFVGFNQTISYTLKITRLGNRVFLYVPSWTAGVTNNSGGSALCITATAMPSRFWAPNGVGMIAFGYLNGNANLVWIFVNSVGNILIYKGVGVGNATWGNTEACRIEGFSIDWTIN